MRLIATDSQPCVCAPAGKEAEKKNSLREELGRFVSLKSRRFNANLRGSKMTGLGLAILCALRWGFLRTGPVGWDQKFS